MTPLTRVKFECKRTNDCLAFFGWSQKASWSTHPTKWGVLHDTTDLGLIDSYSFFPSQFVSYLAKSSKRLPRSYAATLETCLVQVSLQSTVTPKISNSLFSASLVLPKNRSHLVGFRFLEIVIALHFDGSNVIFHLSAQLFILSRSLFRLAVTASPSSEDLISQKRVESSAYKYSGFSDLLPRSSIKIEDKSGPSIEHWGTEVLIEKILEDWPDRTTWMDLLNK